MSFNTEVVKPGQGRAIRVDISLDDFATIAYRYSDVAGVLDGTNQYEPRVLELGTVRRAFGQNRIAASSSTSLQLDNADGAIDWICGRANIETAKLARFRIYVALYDPTASPLVFTEKRLGEFVLSSWPSRDNAVVSLNLADDFMGKLGAGLLTPTLMNWQSVGTATNNPIKNAIGIPSRITEQTPLQLAYGEDMTLAFPHIIPWDNQGGASAYYETVIVPLYCTTDTAAVSQDLIQQVTVEILNIGTDGIEPQPLFVTIPRTVDGFTLGAGVPDTWTVWRVEKSPTITKGGIDFQIVYLVVRSDLGNYGFRYGQAIDPVARADWEARMSALAYQGNYPIDAVTQAGLPYALYASRVQNWYVRATPGSQITNPPSSGLGVSIAHAIDVMTDLASVYSSATVDATSAARIKAGSPFAAAAGVVQPWTERANNPSVPPPPLSLRQVFSELAQSSDIDVFINWAGEVAFSSDVMDFTTATQPDTLLEIRETDISAGPTQWIPSDGERHSPFNRVSFAGGKKDPTTQQDVPFQGPFDLEDAAIPTTAGSVEVVLRQGWRPYRQQALDPWQWRSLDGVCRDRVQFSMPIHGLRLELGAYFKLTWTRGPTLAGPYDGVIFQCESITYAPGDDTVEIEGIWRDDTQTERQYLLDDETLLVRSKGALTGSATTIAADTMINFGGTIDLLAMGAAKGDILILRDTAQAADVFTLNAAFRITSIDSATAILVAVAPTASGVVVNADWSIVRGATTYPTAVSDPTNYPEGGSMYGKATAANGTTSDTAVGNRLISG